MSELITNIISRLRNGDRGQSLAIELGESLDQIPKNTFDIKKSNQADLKVVLESGQLNPDSDVTLGKLYTDLESECQIHQIGQTFPLRVVKCGRAVSVRKFDNREHILVEVGRETVDGYKSRGLVLPAETLIGDEKPESGIVRLGQEEFETILLNGQKFKGNNNFNVNFSSRIESVKLMNSKAFFGICTLYISYIFEVEAPDLPSVPFQSYEEKDDHGKFLITYWEWRKIDEVEKVIPEVKDYLKSKSK